MKANQAGNKNGRYGLGIVEDGLGKVESKIFLRDENGSTILTHVFYKMEDISNLSLEDYNKACNSIRITRVSHTFFGER